MISIRPSAVAGLYYPARSAELEDLLAKQFDKPSDHIHHHAKALIVPHGGYFYSGQVAAKAYQSLMEAADDIERVILIGPSHRTDFKGIAMSEADYFATPIGSVAVDKKIYPQLSRIKGVETYESPHDNEHCLEVQLPFLQYSLNQFEIVPLLTGKASSSLIADVLGTATQDAKSLIVISSDLSHYLDYETARKIDQYTSQAIISMDNHDIDKFHACGCDAIRGFLEYARNTNMSGQIMALSNSGDIVRKKESVVGYGAYLFE